MLYKSYRDKIIALKARREKFRKYRILIIICSIFLLAGISALLSVKGIIKEDGVLLKNEYIYGDQIQLSGYKTLLGNYGYYEYSQVDNENWSSSAPKDVGNYKVRLASKRAFGIREYGQEQNFVINQKRVEIEIDCDNVVYGEDPKITYKAQVLNGDKITFKKFELDYKEDYTVHVSVLNENVLITDSSGKNVSQNYDKIIYGKTANFYKRNVIIQTDSVIKEYTGQAIKAEKYTFKKGYGLASGDVIDENSVDFIGEYINVGVYENKIEKNLVIRNALEEDVSFCYDVTYQFGNVQIGKKNISLQVVEQKEYDGTNTSSNIYRVNGIIEGQNLTSSIKFDSAEVGERKLIFDSFKVMQGVEDVTENYEYSSVFGTGTILKKTIKINRLNKEVSLSAVGDSKMIDLTGTNGYYITKNPTIGDDYVQYKNYAIKFELISSTTVRISEIIDSIETKHDIELQNGIASIENKTVIDVVNNADYNARDNYNIIYSQAYITVKFI